MENLNYVVPINIFESFDDGFFIQGIAINATITDNNHKFLPQELRKSAKSLNGRPLLSDHEDKLKSIIGRVVLSKFDEIDNAIKFKAKLNDTEQGKLAKQLIKAGDLNTVSIGANIERFEEEGDVMIPIGIKFKELSLVATPADDGAQFTLIQSLDKLTLKTMIKEENILDKIMRKLSGGEKLLDEEIDRLSLIIDTAKGVVSDADAKRIFRKIKRGETLDTDDQSILSIIIDVARKRKESFNTISGSISYSTDLSDDQLNNRRKIMEKDETTDESKEETSEEEESKESKKSEDIEAVDEMKKDIFTLKSSISDVSNQLKAQSDLLGKVLSELKEIQEADVDEVPEESKESEPEKEKEAEKETEESDSEETETEEESEDESVGENYKIVQGYKSFTVEKNKYR